MNLNIGITLNETITDAVVDQLIEFDPSLAERSPWEGTDWSNLRHSADKLY